MLDSVKPSKHRALPRSERHERCLDRDNLVTFNVLLSPLTYLFIRNDRDIRRVLRPADPCQMGVVTAAPMAPEFTVCHESMFSERCRYRLKRGWLVNRRTMIQVDTHSTVMMNMQAAYILHDPITLKDVCDSNRQNLRDGLGTCLQLPKANTSSKRRIQHPGTYQWAIEVCHKFSSSGPRRNFSENASRHQHGSTSTTWFPEACICTYFMIHHARSKPPWLPRMQEALPPSHQKQNETLDVQVKNAAALCRSCWQFLIMSASCW